MTAALVASQLVRRMFLLQVALVVVAIAVCGTAAFLVVPALKAGRDQHIPVKPIPVKPTDCKAQGPETSEGRCAAAWFAVKLTENFCKINQVPQATEVLEFARRSYPAEMTSLVPQNKQGQYMLMVSPCVGLP